MYKCTHDQQINTQFKVQAMDSNIARCYIVNFAIQIDVPYCVELISTRSIYEKKITV